MTALMLFLSVVMSTGRNVLSKRLSGIRFGSRSFFICQSILFLFGGGAVALFGNVTLNLISAQTVLYAVLYGVLLIFSQWFYTAAISVGNTALCSTVYSLGFIFPTLSGVVFWSEPFSVIDFFGILCAGSAIVFSGIGPQKTSEANVRGKRYFIPLLVAMLASGGLGIVQKLQQASAYANEKSVFLLIAFLLASCISLLAAMLTKNNNASERCFSSSSLIVAACIGAFFGCCNLLNTILAGVLPSAVFFPTLNIGVIFLTLVCSIFIYKEKLGKNELFALSFCIAAILLLNIG